MEKSSAKTYIIAMANFCNQYANHIKRIENIACEMCFPRINKMKSIVFRIVTCILIHFSYPSCSGARAPGLAADMHFKDDVIAFIGPACAFALEPVARLAAYWNTPIITGMGDQVRFFLSGYRIFATGCGHVFFVLSYACALDVCTPGNNIMRRSHAHLNESHNVF